VLTEFDACANVFEEMGYEAGGYAWHGVVDSLVRLHAPQLRRKIKFDPEASMFAAYSKKLDVIRQIAELIRAAMNSPDLLREAIENANPDLMD
jgi:hypothetical protein